MKKTIFTIVFLLLFFIALFLTSCRESDHHESDNGGNSGNDYGDNSGNGSNNDWYTPSSPVSIITRTYLTKQKQGEQLSTDKFYEGEDVFLRLVLQATNSANTTQNVSLTITIENATYLDAYNEETGNVAKVSVSIGAQVNAISDFMFSKLNIEAIWIPREVTSIGKNAFAGCSKFQGLTCNHTTPPTLGAGAFNECINFGYISVLEGSEAAFKAALGWSDYADKIRTWKPQE